MRDNLANRIIKEGEYIATNKATVRQTAKEFGLGKSTIHKDVTIRLKLIDKELYESVKKILKLNLEQRHIRGGFATKEKYRIKREIIEKLKP